VEIDWLLAGALALASLALLVVAKWRTERDAWSDWDVVRGDVRAAMLEWLRVHTSVHLRALSRALRLARYEHEQPDGRPGEVRRALNEADDVAGRHVYFGLERLRRWRRVARTLATLRPLPPLPASAVHTLPLRRLALAQRLGAALLADGGRFLFGLRVQGLALRMVGWAFDAARRRAARDARLARALGEMETGRDDLAALDGQALTIFECLLASLPSEDASTRDGSASPGSQVR
jgi:hypothetical protein